VQKSIKLYKLNTIPRQIVINKGIFPTSNYKKGIKMSFELTETQRIMKNMVDEFAKKELEPTAEERDQNAQFSKEIFNKLSQQMLTGLLIPQDYSGSGLDMLSYTIVIEALSKVCASTAITLEVHSTLGTYPINKYGTPEQKEKFVKPLAAGAKLGAYAVTEPNAGSDIGAIETTAALDGEQYVLNGKKMFIINGGEADIVTVAASTDKEKGINGLSLFIVEKGTPGFSIGVREDTMGLRATNISELIFENCRVPKENLLGAESDGNKITQDAWGVNRIGIAAQAVGIAQAAYDASIEYSKTRVQFGQTISNFQAIQWMIANMAINLEASRLLVRQAAYQKDADQDFLKAASIAKVFASESTMETAIKAIQVHGGIGYTTEYPIERYFRDAKATEIYGGTSEIQRDLISKKILA
jgi:alkylation response protein AidB-like acyl-CoA dehydrogenase